MPTSSNKHTYLDIRVTTLTVVFLVLVVGIPDADSTIQIQKFEITANVHLFGAGGGLKIVRSHIECCVLCLTTADCRGSNFRLRDNACQMVTNSEGGLLSNDFWVWNVRLSCGSGWIQYGSFCYKWVDAGQSWTNALTSCEGMGGSLASLDTPSKVDFVTSQLASTSFDSCWIGARDSQRAMEYRWMDGAPLGADIPWWGAQEPSHAGNQCVQLRYNEDVFYILNQHCGLPYSYLCEKMLK